MPLRSKAQQRWMFAAEARGELEEGTAKDWAHHTKNIKSLPERVGKKKKKKKRSKSASVFLCPSLVHGTGLFVSRDIRRGEKIARAMIRMRGEDSLDRYELTKAARYTNHSQEPTARLAKEGHEIYLAALQDISAGDEIFVDYRKTSAALGPGSYLTYQGKKRVSAEKLEKQAIEIHEPGPADRFHRSVRRMTKSINDPLRRGFAAAATGGQSEIQGRLSDQLDAARRRAWKRRYLRDIQQKDPHDESIATFGWQPIEMADRTGSSTLTPEQVTWNFRNPDSRTQIQRKGQGGFGPQGGLTHPHNFPYPQPSVAPEHNLVSEREASAHTVTDNLIDRAMRLLEKQAIGPADRIGGSGGGQRPTVQAGVAASGGRGRRGSAPYYGSPPSAPPAFWSRENWLNILGDDSRDPTGPGSRTSALVNAGMDMFPELYKDVPRSGAKPQPSGPHGYQAGLHDPNSNPALYENRVRPGMRQEVPTPLPAGNTNLSYAYLPPGPITQHSPRRVHALPTTPMNRQTANQLMRPGSGNPRNIFNPPGQNQLQTSISPAWHAQARPRVTPKLTIPAPRQTLPKTTPGVSLAAGGVTKYESAIPGYQGTLIDRGMRLLEKQAEEGKGFLDWTGGMLNKLVDSPEKRRFWNAAGSDASTPGRNAVDKAVNARLTTWSKNYHAQQRAARRGPPVRTQSSLPKRPFNIQQTDAQRGVPELPEVARSTGRPLLTVRDDRAQPPATPNLVSPTQGVNQPKPSGFGTPRDVFIPPGQKTIQTLTPPAWHAQPGAITPRLRATVPRQKPSRPAESQGDLIARGTGLLGQKYNQTAANTKPTSLTVTR